MAKTLPICVIGAGSWGTALAIVLARHGQPCRLWGHDPAKMAVMAKTGTNPTYLPAVVFPENLQIFVDLASALTGSQDILLAVPSSVFRSTLQQIAPYLQPNMRLIWATKGLDPYSSKLLHEVVAEIVPTKLPTAVLSGPSFAKETAAGLPTAVVIASTFTEYLADLIARFHGPYFRVYSSTDLIGVQIGGIIKNILAIATGISDGLKFGANARSALITRGLAEMVRFGVAFGAEPQTFMGLAGLGDLVLTCTDNQSRNRRLGLLLAEGKTVPAAEQIIGQVVEGAHNAITVQQLAQQQQLELPIIAQVCQVLYHQLPPAAAVANLLMRTPKAELDGTLLK